MCRIAQPKNKTGASKIAGVGLDQAKLKTKSAATVTAAPTYLTRTSSATGAGGRAFLPADRINQMVLSPKSIRTDKSMTAENQLQRVAEQDTLQPHQNLNTLKPMN
jgi:hypothetical protein